ncbi:MAG: alanyl-tRNA editing protein [Thermoplasmata archaeon HGW-Thermoplasmata-2]|nr:MAG: alanyl-tRNA editing protein [Thermoplasmata archaeon HGW-Thermoplasmata-2]
MTEFLFMKSAEANYVREFDAVVMETGADPSNGQYVILDKTAFYAEGPRAPCEALWIQRRMAQNGGQLTDTGVLSWENGARQARVKLVTKKSGVKHFLALAQGEEAPQKGAAVRGILDWENRYALMRYHTGQHLLSAAVYDLYNGAHTVGNQIYANKSRADFYPAKFTDEDLKRIEDECNRRIALKPDVKIYEESRSSLEARMPQQRANLDLLPKSVTMLRIVEIGGFDIVPCAGTHVRSLSELGRLKITGRETKGADKERVTFVLEKE